MGKRESGAAAPRIAEDLFAAPGLNLRREAGAGFTVPWRKKKKKKRKKNGIRDFG